ncbi:ABC transporter substrate-binding protein [Streptomyces sp. F63]|uniref:ABC transporter substrate-binding protein n=1 Tax=Streptomyces sp. F63 TaxID=2824887 RepID=UPI001B3778CB|nr:ABC transporter substrate-binding protein [Streptomyces sp. F63]MBQ0985812.1 ABC transporter substrate-binding protein [Streptomyces sp. F63]
MHPRRFPTRRPGLPAAALTAAAALALSGCTASAGQAGSVLTVSSSAAVTTLDPVKSFSTEAMYLGNVYEPLLWKNPAGSAEEYTPAIAESWRTSADAKTWTFTIRKGVTFHDGGKVDAAAVKKSILAAKKDGGASFIWAPLDSIDTPDPSTVVMRLGYAAPMERIVSSTYGAWIVSPKALAAAAKSKGYYEKKGLDGGTGPYRISSYTPGKEVVLDRYAGHWDRAHQPSYKTVDVQITPDAVTAQQMLTSGEVDFTTSFPLQNVKKYSENPDYSVLDYPSPFNFVAFFNTTRKPLDNPKVRRALSYATPYDDIIAVGAQGYGTPAHGPVPTGLFPHDPAAPAYTQDLEKARKLLAEAGHPGGGFTLDLTYASENQAEARFVPLIKDAYAKVGVTVNVTSKLFNQQWATAKADPAKAQDIFVLYYWPTYSDAGSDNLYSLYHSSEKPFFNLSYWKNAKYDRLVDKAGTLTGTDPAKAGKVYGEAMDILYDQAPGLSLYDAKAVYVVPKKVKGFAFNENYPFTVFFRPMKSAGA